MKLLAKIIQFFFPSKKEILRAIPINEDLVINERGVELVKHFESCLKPVGNSEYTSYPDPGYGWQVPTIGWGSTYYENGNKVKQGDVITQERADKLLMMELNEKAVAVKKLVRVPLTDDEFSALVSFAYNVGAHALETSTLLRRLNEGDKNEAAAQFGKWTYSNGKQYLGLVRRRESEKNLFLGKKEFISYSV